MGTAHNILRMRILARTSNHQNEKKKADEETYQAQYIHPFEGFDNPYLPQPQNGHCDNDHGDEPPK
jgi:hypothetical protein